ncbi:HSP20-like chaperone [Punctularia strigosozonata HHB-11173 SS5]|uniref:HSP20-like chaperone n=1 Tax=Punctularia strigosozonata (strain HHB-11173) TaxID=741275 RepID=UPI0004417584|nr:HSP20-like chaperone [Punctularia strigosozonata HHB-11173 SS5]EIN12599.1 HSP20-like chaperone [Punctularia strigosozonata HHB-11173 SS5]
MLEEPLSRSPSYFAGPGRSILEDSFFNNPGRLRPAVDVSEEGNSYVVEAELPGVKKENVEVSIGEGGRALLTAGYVGTTAVTKSDQSSSQLSTERAFTGSATFSRTVWLPRPVDAAGVTAQLTDGVLTVKIPKAEDKASVKIPVA